MMGGAGSKVSSADAFVRVAKDPEKYAATLAAIEVATQERKAATLASNEARDEAIKARDEANATIATLADERAKLAAERDRLGAMSAQLEAAQQRQKENEAGLAQSIEEANAGIVAANAKLKSDRDSFDAYRSTTQASLDSDRAALTAANADLQTRTTALVASEAAHEKLRGELRQYLAKA